MVMSLLWWWQWGICQLPWWRCMLDVMVKMFRWHKYDHVHKKTLSTKIIKSSPLNSPFFMTSTMPNAVVLCMNSTETDHWVWSLWTFLEAVFIQQDNAYNQWSRFSHVVWLHFFQIHNQVSIICSPSAHSVTRMFSISTKLSSTKVYCLADRTSSSL